MEQILTAILIFGPVILGAYLGVLLVKYIEKQRQEKLMMGELKFYIGLPIGVLMLISICIMLNMK
ncbi:MAG: hypothetical protein E7264_05575 [Lachnospiraceae bacterium]|nr:hypothetical protein [Lachnospiraceae bacterium]